MSSKVRSCWTKLFTLHHPTYLLWSFPLLKHPPIHCCEVSRVRWMEKPEIKGFWSKMFIPPPQHLTKRISMLWNSNKAMYVCASSTRVLIDVKWIVEKYEPTIASKSFSSSKHFRIKADPTKPSPRTWWISLSLEPLCHCARKRKKSKWNQWKCHCVANCVQKENIFQPYKCH